MKPPQTAERSTHDIAHCNSLDCDGDGGDLVESKPCRGSLSWSSRPLRYSLNFRFGQKRFDICGLRVSGQSYVSRVLLAVKEECTVKLPAAVVKWTTCRR